MSATVKTIEVKVVAGSDGVAVGTAQLWPMDFSQACDLLGIGAGAKNPRTTRNDYRKWLGFGPGQMLSPDEFQQLHWMLEFVSRGRGGRHFSRRNYIELRESGRLAQELERLGIKRHPLTVDNP